MQLLDNMTDVENKKRILFVLPKLTLGGMERVMIILAENFIKRGIEVRFLLYTLAEHFYKIPETIMLYEPRRNNRMKFFFVLKNIIRYKLVCRKFKPDAILSFGQTGNQISLLANLGSTNRLFISDRGDPGSYSQNWLERNIRKYGAKYVTGFIAQSQIASRIIAKETHATNVRVIGNPIVLIENNFLENSKREDIILSAGRFIKSKNFKSLIEWFWEIDTKWKLLIVGDGPEFQDCINLVNSRGSDNRVILPGKSSNLRDYYLKSKLFAFTSTSEGFPNVVGEALSAGLPVIGFASAGQITNLVKDGENGFLLKEFDKTEFIDRLHHLIHNEPLRNKMSKNAIKSIERYSDGKIAEQYLSFMIN